MDQQVELNIEKFAQIDNRLFTSANVIDALKLDALKQADFIKFNRDGLKEVMSQLDEIDMEIDLNTEKQYFVENQMEVVTSKLPIKDFYG